MGCLIIAVIFAVCIGVGCLLGPVGMILGAILALYICAKLNSK